MKVIDGQQFQPNGALCHPYFSIIKDKLYGIMQDTKEEMTQFSVPRGCSVLLFHASHHNPLVGHLVQIKTLNPMYIGQVFAVMYTCTVWHVTNVTWWIGQPHQKHHYAFKRFGMDLVGPLEWSAQPQLCVSLSGLTNMIPGSHALQHLSTQPCGSTLQSYLLSWSPQKDPNWLRHYFHVTHASRTVQIPGD